MTFQAGLMDVPVETAPATVGDMHSGCRVLGQILDRIGDKWTIMVVGVLARGPYRFNAIMREIGGVSHRMLTLTLRSLERDGLVTRTAFATIPPRVEYELTEVGRSLIDPLTVLKQWAIANRPQIEASRTDYDAER
jgi:DNA-binding HxlR family transcriptional regulator